MHKFHLETSKPEEGTHYCNLDKEDFQLTINKCACFYLEKTGIPCSHLISLRKILGMQYLSLFSKRWILEGKGIEEGAEGEEMEEEEKPNTFERPPILGKVGKPKISRKRRH